MKQFDIPSKYRSSFIGAIKGNRKATDPRKKDFSPTILDFGSVKVHLARHFGFCYGVENAIEKSYQALDENPGKDIFLLSQMIHNPAVNDDLTGRGIRFILDTAGNQLTPWSEVHSESIVIIPAFGTTLEIEQLLKEKGIETATYNTTCPFVEKVWKTAAKLGSSDHSIIIHGKFNHEETRATLSHSQDNAPSIVIKDIAEARVLGEIILGNRPVSDFEKHFKGRFSSGFSPEKDLEKVGVINQTTMLATETHEIAQYFKKIMIEKYGLENIGEHYADTRDTLCYATNDNQQATHELVKTEADLALVVGGYNSSNTSHLVDLCAEYYPTYFISGAECLKDNNTIEHFDYHAKALRHSKNYLPDGDVPRIILTSGASCPDSVLDSVLDKILGFYPEHSSKEAVLLAHTSG